MKCIYRESFGETPHCDKKADYVFLGKSYCAEHLKIRADEADKNKAEQEVERQKLLLRLAEINNK